MALFELARHFAFGETENPKAVQAVAHGWMGVDLLRQRKRDQSSTSTVRGAQHI
ncbi:MAG: hypothetical protein WB760_32990 [Xanthobacteraceae bacterium]